MLPHGEFRQAMLTFYAVTKGKRALDQIEEGRFSFSAWGRRIPAATRSSSAMTILDAEKFAPSKNGEIEDGAKSGAKIGAAATTSAKCDCDLGNLRARSLIVPRFQSHATTTR